MVKPAGSATRLYGIDVVAAVILTVLAAVIAVTTLVAAYRSLSPLPLFDQWGFLDPSYVWHGLFEVHSEHRIVLSKLVFLADLKWLGGRNIAEYVVTAVMLLSLGGLYWAAVGLDRSEGWAHRALAAATVICFAISPVTIGVLLWGMHVQNVGVNLFAGLAFFMLARGRGNGPATRGSYWTLLLAVMFAVFATFTSASGLLASFLLVVEAAALRMRWRDITGIALAAVITAVLFLHDNPAQGHATETITSSPWGAAKFLFMFLGCIVPQAVTLSDAVTAQPLVFALGLASVVVLVFNAFVYLRRSRREGREALAVFSIVSGLFFLASACLVAAGRFPYGIDHAFTEHYNILRVMYWATLLLSIGACWKTAWAWRVAGALTICAAVVLCMDIPLRKFGLRYRDVNMNDSAAAIAADVYDATAWHAANEWSDSDPAAIDFMRGQGKYLRQNHLSIFHDAPAGWADGNIHSLPVAIRSVEGAITESKTHLNGQGPYQIVLGWVKHRVQTDKEPQIVLVDGSGNIVGFGAIGIARTGQAEWKGYASSGIAPVAAYLYSTDRLCLLANK